MDRFFVTEERFFDRRRARITLVPLMAAGMALSSRFADLTLPPAWTAVPLLVGGGLLLLVASAAVAVRLPRSTAR